MLYKQVKQANRTLIFRLHFCFNIHPWPWSLKAQQDDGGQRDPHRWALKELQHLICSTWEKLKKPAHCSKSTLIGALFFLTLLLGFIFSLTHPSVECICLLMLESNVRKKKGLAPQTQQDNDITQEGIHLSVDQDWTRWPDKQRNCGNLYDKLHLTLTPNWHITSDTDQRCWVIESKVPTQCHFN